MLEESGQQSKRRLGRTMACEGLLASRLGQRPCRAGARALEQLRAGQREVERRRAGLWLPCLKPLIDLWDKALRMAQEAASLSSQSRRFALATAAVSLVLLIGGAVYSLTSTSGAAPILAEVSGPGVGVERAGKKLAAKPGLRLKDGDVLETTKGTRAAVQYPRGLMTIEMVGQAQVRLAGGPRLDRVELRQGAIMVSTSSGAVERAATLVTSQAQVRMDAARFYLAARQTSTWLGVMEGEVSLRRLDARAVAVVRPREYAVAAPGLELAALPAGERWQAPYRTARPGS
jgi:hypothetical protein